MNSAFFLHRFFVSFLFVVPKDVRSLLLLVYTVLEPARLNDLLKRLAISGTKFIAMRCVFVCMRVNRDEHTKFQLNRKTLSQRAQAF